MGHRHFTLADFETLDFGPAACGCGGWLRWDAETGQLVENEDPFEYYVCDPEYKTKGDEVVALVVRRG